jgi:hypothetical protein
MFVEQLVEENFLKIPKYLEKTCSSTNLSSINFMWPDLRLSTGELKRNCVQLHLQETNGKQSGTKVYNKVLFLPDRNSECIICKRVMVKIV